MNKTTSCLNFTCCLAFLLLSWPFMACSQISVAPAKPYKYRVPLTGILFYTNSYCGGARPTQEILTKCSTPKLLPNTTLHLRAVGDTSSTYYSLVTDKEGKFSTCIPPGTYNIFLTDKYDASALPEFDPECPAWLEQALSQVEIREDIPTNTALQLRLFFHCNPCQLPRS